MLYSNLSYLPSLFFEQYNAKTLRSKINRSNLLPAINNDLFILSKLVAQKLIFDDQEIYQDQSSSIGIESFFEWLVVKRREKEKYLYKSI